MGIYRVLVAAEVALAAVLLVSSALLIRTVVQMTSIPTGVSNDRAVTGDLQLFGPAYQDWNAVAQTYQSLLADIRQRPGIRSVGATTFLPLDPGWRVPFTIEGQPAPRPEEAPLAQFLTVTEGYFETMGSKVVAGRAFTSRDTADKPGVVIVNETFAKRFLSDGSVLGRRLRTTSRAIGPLGTNLIADGRIEVVGVVGDIRNMPFGQPTEPAMFFPHGQYPFRSMVVTVDAVDTQTATAAMLGALRQYAPATPAASLGTWGDRLRTRSAEPRLLMTLLVFFASLAGLLASIGVYGLFSWIVALRRRELAIRLTLGARPSGVAGLVLRQGALLVIAGLVAGWIIIRLSGHAIARVLFQVSPADPLSTTLAGVALFAAAIIACLPPAIRAMRVQPSEGLRQE